MGGIVTSDHRIYANKVEKHYYNGGKLGNWLEIVVGGFVESIVCDGFDTGTVYCDVNFKEGHTTRIMNPDEIEF